MASIYLVNDEDRCFEMPLGINILGRGDLLGIDDKQCSRKQAELEVKKDSSVFLTPVCAQLNEGKKE